jgi:CDP-diacylglycerol---glycerol-3-phosphate 3-phosphatidyltransferase
MLDRPGPIALPGGRRSLMVPRAVVDVTLRVLDRVAGCLVDLGVAANTVTVAGLVLAAAAGVLLSTGHLAFAAATMTVASIGDALDGLVARRSGSASLPGALLDASVDRYEEFFLLGGLCIYFRGSVPATVLTLMALSGSFMVSYGSAKAEALGVPVPEGAMRRAERALCLCGGVALAAVLGWAAESARLPAWAPRAPLLVAVAIVAIVANVSAIRRLRALARTRDDAAHAAPRDAAPDGHVPLPRDGSSLEPARVVAARPALRLP